MIEGVCKTCGCAVHSNTPGILRQIGENSGWLCGIGCVRIPEDGKIPPGGLFVGAPAQSEEETQKVFAAVKERFEARQKIIAEAEKRASAAQAEK